MARFLIGRRGDELLWAGVDEAARYLDSRVADRRFAAYCAPYRSEAEARAALIAAGAGEISVEAPKRGKRG